MGYQYEPVFCSQMAQNSNRLAKTWLRTWAIRWSYPVWWTAIHNQPLSGGRRVRCESLEVIPIFCFPEWGMRTLGRTFALSLCLALKKSYRMLNSSRKVSAYSLDCVCRCVGVCVWVCVMKVQQVGNIGKMLLLLWTCVMRLAECFVSMVIMKKNYCNYEEE